MENLRDIFETTASKYTGNKTSIHTLWDEIENHYSVKRRYYHNLSHLQNIFNSLQPIKDIINDWDTMVFSVFYHDIIYDIKRNDNEEKSAELAQKRLAGISYPDELIVKCCNQILATKNHRFSDDRDTNIFTDSDLAILGQTEDVYIEYAKQIRKEYSIIPKLLYNKGRIKVLTHFMEMERIFKSDYFFHEFEAKARQNIDNELMMLS